LPPKNVDYSTFTRFTVEFFLTIYRSNSHTIQMGEMSTMRMKQMSVEELEGSRIASRILQNPLLPSLEAAET
jgi:hypothetical protein